MQGKCLCGAVRFEIVGQLPKLYQCHCSKCRKVSGSASNTAMIVKADQFQWHSGYKSISSYETPSGFKSEFCRQCGSPVPNKARNGNMYWVPVGLLEDPLDSEVVMHVYTGSKASWDNSLAVDTAAQYDEMPEFGELMQKLHPQEA